MLGCSRHLPSLPPPADDSSLITPTPSHQGSPSARTCLSPPPELCRLQTAALGFIPGPAGSHRGQTAARRWLCTLRAPPARTEKENVPQGAAVALCPRRWWHGSTRPHRAALRGLRGPGAGGGAGTGGQNEDTESSFKCSGGDCERWPRRSASGHGKASDGASSPALRIGRSAQRLARHGLDLTPSHSSQVSTRCSFSFFSPFSFFLFFSF